MFTLVPCEYRQQRATSPDTNALLSSQYFEHVLFHNIFQLIQLKYPVETALEKDKFKFGELNTRRNGDLSEPSG